MHLLYVPTIFCNMGCHYCYLGQLTEQPIDSAQVLNILDVALEKLLTNGYLPFNLSFHGGEVTTLPSTILDQLFSIAAGHYEKYRADIQQLGFKISPVHVKTNLLQFDKHYDIFLKHQVSISGSVDLPLQLHEQYRRDKKNRSTLPQILMQLKRLAQYPYRKKISCVVTQAHFHAIDAFIADIHYLHDEIGLDMSRFNVMFGFDSAQNKDKFAAKIAGTEMLTPAQQVEFYQAIKKAFLHTPLEQAFYQEWFKEFTPEYCCSAPNCGNKFFLLQANGDVYSCPRGQSSLHYRYGNIFTDDIEDIINNGWKVIERNENRLDIDAECQQCAYIAYCHSGCTFVRDETQLKKSYTCELQKVMYQDAADKYPPWPADRVAIYVQRFLLRNNLKQLSVIHRKKTQVFTPEIIAPENSLAALIDNDPILRDLYRDDLFFLQIDHSRYYLQSAILKTEYDMEFLDVNSEIYLGIHQDTFTLATDDIINNHLHLMLLRNTTVIYGDEKRQKQEHIFDYLLHYSSCIKHATVEGNYWIIDIAPILKLHAHFYLPDIKNNLFITTKALRDYHYLKHKKNAFYHIQAINLPFQNLEFFWQETSHDTSN
ncbi:hypothetical protein TPSD3_06035 [Thioflexithrix psekupsensis]|uniref:4Fe4S-binding SPASM domain-containing protein n=1 Tax=Thioflexithrix psekupsensis TaxID=1570016 RepID=A0A251XA14_9GAMM|nr:hypothetical protein TPSD3_06035 [Thioflexithrix psekupsensis]